MTVHYRGEDVELHHGDCLDVLATLPDNSVDAVVTDPPYGLEFMGKEWDSFASERTQYHGERADTSKNISNDSTRPSSRHRVSYSMSRPTFRRCTVCAKREFSGSPCTCAEPIWVYEQPSGPPTRMAAYQSWCQAWATECLRVLKPGGHLLAFGGTRTSHRLACAIEDAGFEIRDSIAWLYGSGFPKSLDVSKAIDKAAGAQRESIGSRIKQGGNTPTPGNSNNDGLTTDTWGDSRPRESYTIEITSPATGAAKQWQGWGTALKPAHEPIIVARKPLLEGTVAANVLAHGVGGLNIDGCRVGFRCDADKRTVREATWYAVPNSTYGKYERQHQRDIMAGADSTPDAGRWPTNVVLDETQAEELDRQSGTSVTSKPSPNVPYGSREIGADSQIFGKALSTAHPSRGPYGDSGDSGGASRFYPVFKYEPKAPSTERPNHNDTSHPTVKPVDLMRWLIRLVTPPGGTVLDPFAGSGTTGEAAIKEHKHAILIEREDTYLPLIVARLCKPMEIGFNFDEEPT